MLDTPKDSQNILLDSSLQIFTGGVSSFDGADYYTFQANSRLSLFLSAYEFSSDVNVSLLDSKSKLLASSNRTGSASESINMTLDSGLYVVKVERPNQSNTNGSPYKIAFTTESLFRDIDDKNPNGQMFYTGDFNGDKIQDALRQERGNLVNGVNDVQFYLGSTSNIQLVPVQVNKSGLFEGNNNRLTLGDFDADGKTDIIRQEINGAKNVQFVTFKDGNFQVLGNVPDMAMMRGDLTNLIAGDFNNDGRDDLIRQERGISVNGNRDVELYISNGKFGWLSQTVVTNAFSVNGNDTLLVAGNYIAGGGKDLIRIETKNSLINGVNDIQFLTYKNGNMQVVSNNPINTAPQSLVINGVKTSYNTNSSLTIDPSFISDNNGWQDINKIDFWLINAQGKRIELADVNSFTSNGANSAKFSYSTSLNGNASGSYKLNAIGYDKAGAATSAFAQTFTINPLYSIGSNGTNVDSAFVNAFNSANGSQDLGQAIGNVQSITGGKVQNFEKGSIFQSALGTFALKGPLNATYQNLSASDKQKLGLPTAAETNAGNYWHQSFQNGELQLVQGVPVKWSSQTLINDRYNALGGVGTLGKSIGNIRNFNGSPVQDYEKGSIFLSGNKTLAITGSIFTSYRANIDTLGLPISEPISTSEVKANGDPRQVIRVATVQNFEKGSISLTSKGTFVLSGVLSQMHREVHSSLGLPIGDKVSTVNGLRQDFENGILVNAAPNSTFALKGEIASYYKALTDPQLKALGAPIDNANNTNDGTRQLFQNGIVYSSSSGTFSVRGVFRERASSRGIPMGEEKVTGDGLRQDFSTVSVTYSAKTGVREVTGNLAKYYQSLTEAEKNKLGVAYTNTWFSGDNSFQFFQGGVVENTNGAGKVRFTPAIGFDGNTFNEKFFDKFMSTGGLDGLGDPTGTVSMVNGVLRQDFQKGFITQNGATMESLLWPTNLGALGNNPLSTTGNNSASQPKTYGFTIDRQTNIKAVLSGIQGNARLTLLNSQYQVVADSSGSGNEVNASLAAGTYIAKVTSESIGSFTLNVQTVVAPPVYNGGGGTIVITFDPPNNNTNNNSTTSLFVINNGGSIGDYYNNKISVEERNHLGTPKANEEFIGNGLEWKQDFQNGTIFHGAKGTFIVKNSLKDYYYSKLSQGDRLRLGMPIGNENQADGYWQQNFERGKLQLIQGTPVKWTDGGNSSTSPSPSSPVSNSTPYTVKPNDTLSGIAQSMLGGASNWTKITDANGNIFTEQQALFLQIGQVIYLPISGYVAPIAPPATNPITNPSTSPIYTKDFYGVVMSTTGVNLRYSPNLGDRSNDNRAYNQVLHFDAWTTGESVVDLYTNQSDNRWFRIAGTNEWVPSGYINGNPDRSVTTPFMVNNPTTPPTSNSETIVNTIDLPDLPPFINRLEQAKSTKPINVQGVFGRYWMTLDELSYDVSSVLKISKNYFKKDDTSKSKSTGSFSISSSDEIELESKLLGSVGVKLNASISNGIGISFGDEKTTLGLPKLTPVWVNSGTFSADGKLSPLGTIPIDANLYGIETSMNLEVKGTYIDMSQLKQQLTIQAGIFASALIVDVANNMAKTASETGGGSAIALASASLSLTAPSVASAITTVGSRGGYKSVLTFLLALAVVP
jgi:uncharacterized protein with LGFP repeats/LysM repeat protein